MAQNQSKILENEHITICGDYLKDDRMLPCPFCGKTPLIVITDEEGNFRDPDYLEDTWSGLSFAILHAEPESMDPDERCPISVYDCDDTVTGVVGYDSIEELVQRWNKRI